MCGGRVHTGSPAGLGVLVGIIEKDADSTRRKFDRRFLFRGCSLSDPDPGVVWISEARHAAPEAVRVLAPTALSHDIAAVVVTQASAQLLVIHARFSLALTPQSRHLGRRPGLEKVGAGVCVGGA